MIDRNAPMGRTEAENSTIACRQPHRTAAIGSYRKIRETAGDSNRRSAGGTTGDAVRGARIDRGAIMTVLPVEAIGELIGLRFPDQACPGIHKTINHAGRYSGRRMGPQPIGAARAGGVTGDVENILGGEGQSSQSPLIGAVERHRRMRAECAEAVDVHQRHP
jgi:hypothetical protein